jgi:hypothetical protein
VPPAVKLRVSASGKERSNVFLMILKINENISPCSINRFIFLMETFTARQELNSVHNLGDVMQTFSVSLPF